MPGSVEVRLGPGAGINPGNPARALGPVDSVECLFGIVISYEREIDVRRRSEWATVAPLPRPVVPPPKKPI